MKRNSHGLIYDYVMIPGERLYLRLPQASDCAGWLRIRARNYEILQAREPVWDLDHLNYNGYYRMLNETMHGFYNGNYYGFMIFDKKTKSVVGHIEVANVLGWPKKSATIGYWMDHTVNNRGYMTEAVGLACKWALKNLDLIRIEAGTMCDNEASQKVLLKNGFMQEGYTRNYGEINGVIVDHYMFGLAV